MVKLASGSAQQRGGAWSPSTPFTRGPRPHWRSSSGSAVQTVMAAERGPYSWKQGPVNSLSPEGQVSPEWVQQGCCRSWIHAGENRHAIVVAGDLQLHWSRRKA